MDALPRTSYKKVLHQDINRDIHYPVQDSHSNSVTQALGTVAGLEKQISGWIPEAWKVRAWNSGDS